MLEGMRFYYEAARLRAWRLSVHAEPFALRTAEIFISSARPGSPIEAIARNAAITASLALQCGLDARS
jgi:hypothetical protein